MGHGDARGEVRGLADGRFRAFAVGCTHTRDLALRNVVRDYQVGQTYLVFEQPTWANRGGVKPGAGFEHVEESRFGFFQQFGSVLDGLDLNMRA